MFSIISRPLWVTRDGDACSAAHGGLPTCPPTPTYHGDAHRQHVDVLVPREGESDLQPGEVEAGADDGVAVRLRHSLHLPLVAQLLRRADLLPGQDSQHVNMFQIPFLSFASIRSIWDLFEPIKQRVRTMRKMFKFKYPADRTCPREHGFIRKMCVIFDVH